MTLAQHSVLGLVSEPGRSPGYSLTDQTSASLSRINSSRFVAKCALPLEHRYIRFFIDFDILRVLAYVNKHV